MVFLENFELQTFRFEARSITTAPRWLASGLLSFILAGGLFGQPFVFYMNQNLDILFAERNISQMDDFCDVISV